MPPLPWKSVNVCTPADRLVAVATELRLARHRDIPAFMKLANTISAEAARSPGLVTYSLHAAPTRKRFRTVTVWRDVPALNEFIRGGRHGAVMADSPFVFTPDATVRWNITGADLPLSWDAIVERLDRARIATASR